MSYFTVYRKDVYDDYKASPVSAAALFQLLLFGIMIGVPIALVAINPDIWPIYNTVYEQPLVRYQQMALVHLDLGGGSALTWSTIPQYNRLMTATLRPAILKIKQDDHNGDGKAEQFRLTLEVPLKPQEQVYGIRMRCRLEMATVTAVQYNSASAGAEFLADGSIRLAQNEALRTGEDYYSRGSLINVSSSNILDYSMANLMRMLSDRNVSTTTEVFSPSWVTGPVPGQPFRADVTIRVPIQALWMETTILHRLTTAGAALTFWLLPFWLACWYFQRFVFSSGILSAVRDASKYSMKNYVGISKS